MKGFNTGIVYCIGKKKCGERYEKRKIRLRWLVIKHKVGNGRMFFLIRDI